MIFTIAVHAPAYASGANHHALQFCEALLRAGHKIARVFFYHEGVYTALSTQVTPQGEKNALAHWQALAEKHHVELAVCIANAIKRGVLSESEQKRYEQGSITLAQPFELVGLGQLIDAIAHSDRYVEFPA